MANTISDLKDEDWRLLAAQARQQTVLSGFYNENYRLDVNGKAYLFRFPKRDKLLLDPQPLKEVDVLQRLAGSGLPVPEILYADPNGMFQVQVFIEGLVLEKLHPPGSKVPATLKQSIINFYQKMATLGVDVSDILAYDWPQKGPMLIYFEKLLETSWQIYTSHQETHGHFYEFLDLPGDPFTPFLTRGALLQKRPWCLIHADAHRGNIIVGSSGIHVIDWELAQYGDLLYCIAAHLHRSRYYKTEREPLAETLGAALPPEFQDNFIPDLRFYLDYEALKSVITDTVRFPQLIKEKGVSRTQAYELAVYYSENLNRLSGVLGTKTTTPEKALNWFEEWAI